MTDRAPAEVLALRDHPNSENSVELDRKLEERVLACLLLDPNLIEQIDSARPALVTPHGKAIANACEAVFRRTASLELMSLADQLEAEGKLEAIGGVEKLARLSDAETSAVHFEDYVKTARARQRRQAIHRLGREISALSDTERAEELASEVLEIARSYQFETVAETPRWPHVTADKADALRGSKYVVDDILHQGTVNHLYGAPGTLKTCLALLFALKIAAGRTLLGRKTRPGLCVIVAAEGSGGIERRLAGLREAHPDVGDEALSRVVVVPKAVKLLDDEEVSSFGTWISRSVSDGPVSLCVFDTQSQSLAGGLGGENSSNDFTLAEQNIRNILLPSLTRDDQVPAALLVHHPGKDESRGARGHSSQFGNLDAVIEVGREKDGYRPFNERRYYLRPTKVKDGPDDWSWRYRGELIHLGERADGKAIVAPVVRPADDDGARVQTTRRVHSGSITDQILQALEEARHRDGTFVPKDIVESSGQPGETETQGLAPPTGGYFGVSVESLLDQLGRTQAGGPDTPGPLRAPSRDSVNRTLRRLKKEGAVFVYDGWVWIANQGEPR